MGLGRQKTKQERTVTLAFTLGEKKGFPRLRRGFIYPRTLVETFDTLTTFRGTLEKETLYPQSNSIRSFLHRAFLRFAHQTTDAISVSLSMSMLRKMFRRSRSLCFSDLVNSTHPVIFSFHKDGRNKIPRTANTICRTAVKRRIEIMRVGVFRAKGKSAVRAIEQLT